MKVAYLKENFRKLNKTKTRFITLVIIVTLGVLFFSGMNSISSDMTNTMNKYLKDTNVADIQIVSNLGFNNDDVNAIKKVDGVNEVYPGYIYDVILEKNEKRIPVRTNSIEYEQNINKPQLVAGRYIENDKECLMDQRLIDERDYHVGDKIRLTSGNDDNIDDEFKNVEFTIVGEIRTPAYISKYYGSTKLENGELLGCIYLPSTVYKADIYTNIYVKTNVSDNIPKMSDEYKDALTDIVSKIEKIGEGQADVRYKTVYKENSEKIIDGRNKIKDVKEQLKDSKNELNDARSKLNEIANQIYNNTYNNPLASYILPTAATNPSLIYYGGLLKNGRVQYFNSLNEYNNKYEDAQKEISDKEKELDDAQNKLDKLSGKWYVIGLYDNNGYVAFKNDLNKAGIMGKVFPVIFFIVTVLVSITTITRMIEEDRGNIAIEKALGYSKTLIIFKYIFYAFSAATIGLVLGTAIGSYVITEVLYNSYRILYATPDLIANVNLTCLLVSILITMLSTVLCAIIITVKELNCKTAELMRPKAPREGKEIFLEKHKSIWERLSFLYKISIRNIFRYKRRLFMTIIGIAGCTALIYVGLSIRDSIQEALEKQYGQVKVYSMQINLDYEMEEEKTKDIIEYVKNISDITDATVARENSTDVKANGVKKSIFYLVANDEEIQNYIKLRNRKTGKELNLQSNGVIISEKLAETLSLRVGDKITIINENSEKEITVTGITENYLFNYMYMSPEVYKQIYEEDVLYNEILANTDTLTENQEKDISEKLKENDKITGVSFTRIINKDYVKSVKSLMTIVFLCIGCASLLSFIVLFNLNSINIEERKRELATIKVLGFYDNEVSSYVFRENIILTILGGLLGLILGTIILKPTLKSAEVETLFLPAKFSFITFVVAFAITILFTLITNKIMNRRLRKIDMIDSLKSIE